MSLTTETALSQYTQSSPGQAFSVPWYFITSTDIKVTRTRSGVDTVLALTTDYSVTGAGTNPSSAVITMVAGLAGDVVTIERAAALTQQDSYPISGPFPSTTLERDLDRITMFVQQLKLQIDRSVRLPNTSTALPALTSSFRSGKVLGFDASGNLAMYDPAASTYVNGGGLTVSTVATLKALTVSGYSTGQQVWVSGYYSAADGGGGLFVYNSASVLTDNGGSVLAPNSGSGRWLRVVDSTRINAKQWGAKGDGVTDDTTRIAAAIAALTSGSVLFFPQGTYNVTGFTIPSSLTNVLICGDQAQLYQTTNANNMFVIDNTSSYITFDGLWFNGVGSSRQNGIHIRTAADYTTVRNCRLERSSDWAIQVNSSGAAVKGFKCHNNLFKDTCGDGVHVMNVDGYSITSNIFWQCGDDAIAAISQSSVVAYRGVIANNFIYGRTSALAGTNTSGNRGIALQVCDTVLVEDNVIYNTKQSAIEVSDDNNTGVNSSRVVIRGNHLYGCNTAGGALANIQIYFANYVTVAGNTIYGPAANSGISFFSVTYLSILDNTILQDANQFCRGIVTSTTTPYNGRTVVSSNQVIIQGNSITLAGASTNEGIYLVFTAGIFCSNLVIAANTFVSVVATYILANYVSVFKVFNNIVLGSGTTITTGANSTSVTTGNNN